MDIDISRWRDNCGIVGGSHCHGTMPNMKTSTELKTQLASVRERLANTQHEIDCRFAQHIEKIKSMSPEQSLPPDPTRDLKEERGALVAIESQLIADLDLAIKAEERQRKQSAADAFAVARLDAAQQAKKAVSAILAGHAILKSLGLNYGGLPKPSWHGFADAIAHCAAESGLRPVAEIAQEIRHANGGDSALHPGAEAIDLAEINPSREAVLSALEGI